MQPPTLSFIAPSTFDAKALFDRVLVPVDFSEGSRQALAAALELRRQFGSEVHLFLLAEWGQNDLFLAGTGAGAVAPQELVEETEARLCRFVDNLFPGQSGEVVPHVQIGVEVVQAIIRNAKKIGSTLVVLAEEPKQTILRSRVEKIVKELDAAVLLLKAPRAV